MRPSLKTLLLVTLGLRSIALSQYLEATIPVGASPHDLLWNPATNRVYCLNWNDGTISVIDGNSNALRTTIRVPEYAANLGLAVDRNKVYCTSGEGDSLYVICASGDTVTRRLKVSGYPQRIAHAVSYNAVYIGRYDGARISVFSTITDSVIATIRLLDQGPVRFCWNPVSGRLFALEHYAHILTVIDCGTNTVTRRWPLTPQTSGLTCNTHSGAVYVACRDSLYVFAADGESAVATIGFPTTDPIPVYYSRLSRLYVGAWCSSPEYPITIVDCVTNTVIDTLPAVMATDMVCDTVRGKLYVLDCGHAQKRLLVYELSDGTLASDIPLGSSMLYYLAWNSLDARLYISDPNHDVVYVIRDTTTAVAEAKRAPNLPRREANFASGAFRLSDADQGELLDASGRKVAVLRPGRNDVRALAPGVYFIRSSSGTPVRRVVIVH